MFMKEYKNVKPVKNENPVKYHCNYCMCPLDEWKPLDTYKSNDSCKVYSDFYNVIWDLEENDKKYNFQDVLNQCIKFKNDYPDIPDFEAAVKEMIQIGIETGIITNLYRDLSVV